jgi:hypothetical protein
MQLKFRSDRSLAEARATVAAVVLLGVFANATWLGEIIWIHGWASLAWTRAFPMAAWVGVVCVAISALLALRLYFTLGLLRAAALTLSLSALGMTAFWLLRGLIFEAARSWSYSWMRALPVWTCAILLCPVGYTFALRLAGVPLRWRSAPLFLLAIALVLPQGWLTIQLRPALHGETDIIHVVKMGYPLFWTCILTACATAWLARGCAASLRDSSPMRREPQHPRT